MAVLFMVILTNFHLATSIQLLNGEITSEQLRRRNTVAIWVSAFIVPTTVTAIAIEP